MALLDLTVESSIEELQAIANQVDGVAEQQGWSQKTVFALQVALDEWISNVIKYSYKERSDQPIRVVVNENEDETDRVPLKTSAPHSIPRPPPSPRPSMIPCPESAKGAWACLLCITC